MKKTMRIFIVIILFTLLQNGCSNNSKKEQGSLIEKDSIDTNGPIKKKITKTEHFRLSSILGTFPPHGGVYEYDAKKKYGARDQWQRTCLPMHHKITLMIREKSLIYLTILMKKHLI